MKKVAVIGCNSFTGGYVVDDLLAAGHQVLGVDRQEKSAAFLPYLQQDLSHFSFTKIDLNQQGDELISLLREQQPEYIINLAALSEVAPSWEHPEQWFETNVVALTRLLDGVRGLPSLKMFTQVSTPEVYGSCEGLVKEDYRLNPSTPYAASKAAFDLSAMTFFKNYNFPVNFTRAANVYGAHQQLFKIIPRTFIYIKLGKTIQLHGGGSAIRSFTHVRDVAKGYNKVMFSGGAGEVYHISTEKMVTIRDIVSGICGLLGTTLEQVTETVPARPGHDGAYTLDFSKIQAELSWEPAIELEAGLSEVHQWIDQYWEEIKQEALEYIHQK